MQSLDIQIVDCPEKAPNYRRDHADVRSATVTKAVIVCRGTVNGHATVDLQFEDEDGGKYVAMLTGALVQNLASAIRGAESRQRE